MKFYFKRIIGDLKDKLLVFSEDLSPKTKTLALLIPVMLISSTVFYNVGKNVNISHTLIEEKAHTDTVYEEALKKAEEQTRALDDINKQLEETEKKLEEYRQSKEEAETELAQLDEQLELKRQEAYPSSAGGKYGSSGKRNIPKTPLSDNSTVYVTKTGQKYHRDGCSSLSKSKIPMILSEAVSKGYTPCQSCN